MNGAVHGVATSVASVPPATAINVRAVARLAVFHASAPFHAHGTITGREALHLSRYGDCPCPTRFNTRWSDTATFSGGGNGCCNELPRPRTVPPRL
jgi:hypothetical protein